MPTRPKPATETRWSDKCMGGQSYGCHHEEHERSKKFPDIQCFRCGVRMGCGWCCEIPRELVCLRCHDFALPVGIKHHGHIVQSKEKQLDEMRQVARAALKGE